MAVAGSLVACYLGFSLLQAALAVSVASALPHEEMGVGMGLYNLVFFMSGAFGAALIGKLLEVMNGVPAVVPFVKTAGAAPYSNLFLSFALASALAGAVFHLSFRRRP